MPEQLVTQAGARCSQHHWIGSVNLHDSLMMGSKNNVAVSFMSINRQILKKLWAKFFSYMPLY